MSSSTAAATAVFATAWDGGIHHVEIKTTIRAGADRVMSTGYLVLYRLCCKAALRALYPASRTVR